MIAKLTGVLDSLGEDWAIIDVGGVGYLIYCSGRTLGSLPQPGAHVSLAIETHVREDYIHLYGFADATERDWFGLLTTVQGVGARVALAIPSTLSPDHLSDAVAAQDRAALSQASGVGPKLALRIVNELKDKAGELAIIRPAAFAASGAAAESGASGGATNDAISALVNLGYRRVEAHGAVVHAARQLGEDAELEALIKAGLRELRGPAELNA